jgi:hypothetical protein
MADRFRTVYNTGDSPVVVDQEGHSIGGGEWGTIDFREKAAKDYLHSGLLVEVKPPDDGTINPAAQTAFTATEDANANVEPDKGDDDKGNDKPDPKTSDIKSGDNKAATAAKKGKE